MSDGLLFVLVVLSAYRLWRLLALDTLPLLAAPRDAIRDAIFRRHGDAWADGIACGWCSGFWASAVVVGAIWALRPLPLPVLWFAATSTVVGLIAMQTET